MNRSSIVISFQYAHVHLYREKSPIARRWIIVVILQIYVVFVFCLVSMS